MKCHRLAAATVLVFFSIPLVTSGAVSAWYTDVEDHFVYYDGIYYLTQSEVVQGYENESFQANQDVSRVEALKMILASTQTNLAWEESVSYPDTEAEAWYMDYVNTAAFLGIATGYEDGLFRPEDPVNRVEALKMLLKAAEAALPDVSNDYWYSAYLAYAQEHALIVPDENGDYLLSAALTRGALSDLIYRYNKEPFTSNVEYGIASYYAYSFDGHNTASGTPLEAYGFMAAHKTLPFGTVIRVTNLENDLSVDVNVVDRGPYTDGYIVDLTPAAFDQIGALSTGILEVRLEVLK